MATAATIRDMVNLEGVERARILWTVSDAADKLGVSRQTIYAWIADGLPVYGRYKYRDGWAPLLDPAQAQAWVQSRRST